MALRLTRVKLLQIPLHYFPRAHDRDDEPTALAEDDFGQFQPAIGTAAGQMSRKRLAQKLIDDKPCLTLAQAILNDKPYFVFRYIPID
jgi:hypothetical protein